MKTNYLVACFLMLNLSCQKSNSQNSNSPSPEIPRSKIEQPKPLVDAEDAVVLKMQACRYKLSSELSLLQIAENSKFMREMCGFTAEEWPQVLLSSFK